MNVWAIVAGGILVLPAAVAIVALLCFVIVSIIQWPIEYFIRYAEKLRSGSPHNHYSDWDVFHVWLIQVVWHGIPWEFVFAGSAFVGFFLLQYGFEGKWPFSD